MDMKLLAHQVRAALRKRGSVRSRDFAEDVDALGFDILDSGCYGVALRHVRSGLVLKVGFTVSDGTMGYIARCAQHFAKHGKAAQYTPEVYAYGRDSVGWWAWMEFVTVGMEGNDVSSSYDIRLRDSLTAFVGPCVDSRGRPMHDDHYFDMHRGNYGTARCGRHVVFDPFGTFRRPATVPKVLLYPKRQHGPARGRWA